MILKKQIRRKNKIKAINRIGNKAWDAFIVNHTFVIKLYPLKSAVNFLDVKSNVRKISIRITA